eukprot:scaffold15200_cov111-Isochrysis_galbana.AAC.10
MTGPLPRRRATPAPDKKAALAALRLRRSAMVTSIAAPSEVCSADLLATATSKRIRHRVCPPAVLFK